MPDPKQTPPAVHSGPVLGSFFSKAHALAKVDAVLTALLCGGAVGLFAFHNFSRGCWGSIRAGLLGLVIAGAVYLAFAPDSVLTACLVSIRKQFLDGLITGAQNTQMRKRCLRKSLLY